MIGVFQKRTSALMISADNARIVFLLLIYILGGCSTDRELVKSETYQTVRGQALGTTWMVKWKGLAGEQVAVNAVVQEELGRLDRLMSNWRDDSEISQVSGQSGPQVISSETAAVLQAALDLASETRGAFDPTVAPLVDLWGFHGRRRTTVPSDAQLASVMKRVGHHRVQLGRSGGQWLVDPAGTDLDLSAIAKGTGVDWISRALLKQDIPHHMVEVGGEVRLSGNGPMGDGWRVGVDDPRVKAKQRRLGFVLQLNDRSVATSGNYRNQYEVDGQTLVHTLDPRTGRPKITNVLSASVIGPDCQTTDGVATALMVMSLEEGKKWVSRRPDVDAAWLVREGDKVILHHTDTFGAYLKEVAPDLKLNRP